MFNQREKQLKKRIDELEIKLESINFKHDNEIEKLKLEHEVELDEVKHLVKLKEEKLDIEHEKEKLKFSQQYVEKEMKLQTEYHEKIIANIEKAQKDLKDLYKEIMIRLPKVKVGIKQNN